MCSSDLEAVDPREETLKLKKQTDAIVLSPVNVINSNQKVHERWKDLAAYNSELVEFIAYNKESPNSSIEIWTRSVGGLPAKFWIVPPGKKVVGPRDLADRLADCSYHVFKMEEGTITTQDGAGVYKGALSVKEKVNRLDAQPVVEKQHFAVGMNSKFKSVK